MKGHTYIADILEKAGAQLRLSSCSYAYTRTYTLAYTNTPTYTDAERHILDEDRHTHRHIHIQAYRSTCTYTQAFFIHIYVHLCLQDEHFGPVVKFTVQPLQWEITISFARPPTTKCLAGPRKANTGTRRYHNDTAAGLGI